MFASSEWQPLFANDCAGEDGEMDGYCYLLLTFVLWVLFPKRQQRMAHVSTSHERNAKVEKNLGVSFCRRQEEMR